MVFHKIKNFIYKICRIKSSDKYSNKTDEEIISENFYDLYPYYYGGAGGSSNNTRPRSLSPESVFSKRVTWEDELASIGTFSPHFADTILRTPTPVPLPQDIEKLIIIDIIDSIIDEVEVQAESI